MLILFFLSLLTILFNPTIVSSRYVEGHVKILEDWVFLARFCFLSGSGRYEYHIEFERRFGEPQLLLYYDDETQWPAIYKKHKTCAQKLEVLHPEDNQIVTLSARSPHNILSGCALRTTNSHTETTLKPNIPDPISPKPIADDLNASYFEQFLPSTTMSMTTLEDEIDSIDATDEFLNSTDSFEMASENDDVEIFNATNQVDTLISMGGDTGGFHNPTENDTEYNRSNVEELFDHDSIENNHTSRVRIKRGFGSFKHSSSFIVTCHSSGGFLTARERWWYIAIANCGQKNGIDIRYKFRMTNGPPGDFWHEHFSADEMYIPQILLAQVLLYTFLLLAITICAIELKNRQLFHCTYRLFALSSWLHYIGVLFLAIAWSKYAIYGVGPYTGLGTICQAFAEIIFLVLLMLMAKGFTITRARISTVSTIKLTVFVNFYIICYLSLFIYREEMFDPGEVLNLYESPAGLGLAVLRCIAWCAFLISTATTSRKFPEKVHFYYPFGILGTMWILGGPILTFIGIAFFDPWIRESVMCGVLALLSACGHISFLWLTWPSRANQSFPYHVRTNHVGVMSASDDGADYPRNVYEPTYENNDGGNPNAEAVIIPLSRRTEEMLNGVYGRYLCERQCYNSPSTPLSYVSFPPNANNSSQYPEPTAPSQSQSPLSHLRHEEEEEEERRKEEKNEQQVDSGHPSLDDTPSTASVKSGITRETEISNSRDDVESTAEAEAEAEEAINSPNENATKASNSDSTLTGVNILKRNPFLINPPNKIILDPINPSALNQAHRKHSPGDVPVHLFAANNNRK